ncbi:hypothetical protein DV737_g1565, partial [Chaetothyriales sp. CBS 132003]
MATAPPIASTLTAVNIILPRSPADTPPYSFSFTPFLRTHGLASLVSTVPVCPTYSSTGSCPLGRRCPNRHPTPNQSSQSSTGGNNTSSAGSHHFSRQNDNYVCKHWLKGLCKKGDACDYLHEYNLRKMSECQFYNANGYCQNGDECLYVHVKEGSKLPLCEDYNKGFCEKGPRCGKRHVRRKLCEFYMAGFCPDGPECKVGVHLKAGAAVETPATGNEEEKARKDRLAEIDRRGEENKKEFSGGAPGSGWKGKKGRGGGGGRWKDKRDRR